MATFIDFMGIQSEIDLRLDEVIKSCGGHPVHCTEFGFSEYLGNEYEAERLADGRILVSSCISDPNPQAGNILLTKEESAYVITEQEFYRQSKELLLTNPKHIPPKDGDLSDEHLVQAIKGENTNDTLPSTYLKDRFERLKSHPGLYDKKSGYLRTFISCNHSGCSQRTSLWFHNQSGMVYEEAIAHFGDWYCREHQQARTPHQIDVPDVLKAAQQLPGLHLEDSGMGRSEMNFFEAMGWLRVERVYRDARVLLHMLYLTDIGAKRLDKGGVINAA